MHSSSIKNNDQFFVAGCKIYFFAPYQYNGGDFVLQCFGFFITITSGCRVVENNVFLGQAQQLAARECGVSYIGLAELPQEHNVHFCSRFTIADNAHHNTFGNWMHCTYRYGHACETEKGGWTRRKSKETQGRELPILGAHLSEVFGEPRLWAECSHHLGNLALLPVNQDHHYPWSWLTLDLCCWWPPNTG